MNELAGVRKKLRQALGEDVPDLVWEDRDIRDYMGQYVTAETDWEREDAWGLLEGAVRRVMGFWNGGREEERKKGPLGVLNGVRGASQDMRDAEERDTGEHLGRFDVWELFDDVTKAMTEAMSALFALLGDDIREVKEFREKVSPGRFLTADEAHALIASSGPVVDELYDISAELAEAFDWPGGASGNLTGTRPGSESAAWFILTGEAPQVRPIDARWEQKHGIKHLAPQWRIQLTIPPWVPEEEVLRAFRFLRRQRPAGHQRPKTAKPLEVARFVWERKRKERFPKRPPWTKWLEKWNEEHPGHRIETASHFRTYFFRGSAAVAHLNLDSPNFEVGQRVSSDST